MNGSQNRNGAERPQGTQAVLVALIAVVGVLSAANPGSGLPGNVGFNRQQNRQQH
jgi:hypothetical protein